LLPKKTQPGVLNIRNLAAKGLLWLESVKSSKPPHPTGVLCGLLFTASEIDSMLFRLEVRNCVRDTKHG
jgi:hypothetical protein